MGKNKKNGEKEFKETGQKKDGLEGVTRRNKQFFGSQSEALNAYLCMCVYVLNTLVFCITDRVLFESIAVEPKKINESYRYMFRTVDGIRFG